MGLLSKYQGLTPYALQQLQQQPGGIQGYSNPMAPGGHSSPGGLLGQDLGVLSMLPQGHQQQAVQTPVPTGPIGSYSSQALNLAGIDPNMPNGLLT